MNPLATGWYDTWVIVILTLGVLLAPGLIYAKTAPVRDSVRRRIDTDKWNRSETICVRRPLSCRDRSLPSGK